MIIALFEINYIVGIEYYGIYCDRLKMDNQQRLSVVSLICEFIAEFKGDDKLTSLVSLVPELAIAVEGPASDKERLELILTFNVALSEILCEETLILLPVNKVVAEMIMKREQSELHTNLLKLLKSMCDAFESASTNNRKLKGASELLKLAAEIIGNPEKYSIQSTFNVQLGFVQLFLNGCENDESYSMNSPFFVTDGKVGAVFQLNHIYSYIMWLAGQQGIGLGNGDLMNGLSLILDSASDPADIPKLMVLLSDCIHDFVTASYPTRPHGKQVNSILEMTSLIKNFGSTQEAVTEETDETHRQLSFPPAQENKQHVDFSPYRKLT